MPRLSSAVLPFVLACLIGLAGCASVPEREPATTLAPPAIPDTYASAPEPAPFPAEPPTWIGMSPPVADLVAEAQRANPDLALAAARLQRALAAARIAGAPRWPSLSASLDADRSSSRVPPGNQTLEQTRFQAGLGVSWEADVWGRLRAEARAASRETAAAAADFAAARRSLAAAVARTWIDLVAAIEQTRLSEQTVQSFQDNERAVDERFQRGLVPGLDLSLVRANTRAAEASLAATRSEQSALRLNLETLLGRYPADALPVEAELPAPRDPVPAGLPAGLLERRPDVRAAFRRLAAADQRVAAARAARLPQLSLTASGGLVSDALGDLAAGDFSVWSLGGGLTAPLFQGGRLAAAEDQAAANRDAARATYRQTVLTAFREVEDALRREQRLREQAEAQAAAAADAAAAEELAVDRYARGLVDVVTVLEAQRRSFNTRSALIAVRRQRLLNRINLWLALGGPLAAEPAPLAAVSSQASADPAPNR